MGASELSERVSSPLEKRLSIQFQFEHDVAEKLLALCVPCEAWLEQFQQGAIELASSPEAAVLLTLEGAANRFLQSKAKPAGKGDQKKYLQSVEKHAQALTQLLSEFPEIDGTISDPFLFLEKVDRRRGGTKSRGQYRSEVTDMLLLLRLFAKARLHKDLAPEPDERAAEFARRRTEYPRFILIADLLAAYKRITGAIPSSYADGDRQKRSPAVEFISIAITPILKKARVKKSHVLNDQTISNEIADVKRFWDEGRNPELAYYFDDWGSRTFG